MNARIARPTTAFSTQPRPERHGKDKGYLASFSSSFEDLTGVRFGMVTVTEYLGKQGIKSLWEYKCDCGNVSQTASGNLKIIQSCGCVRRRNMVQSQTKHGAAVRGRRTPTYVCWGAMVARCTNKNAKDYLRYGGRGITVCAEWAASFEAFIADMGERPTPHHSIDRINNDGNYSSGNCHWGTATQQASNRSSSHYVYVNSVKMTLQAACRMAELADATVHSRIRRGWDISKALKSPSKVTREGGFPHNTTVSYDAAL